MKARPTIVLGLSIGTRKIGTALMTNAHLDCARVWEFPGRWNEQKLKKIISKIHRKLQKYHVGAIAIKVPTPTHHTEGLKVLIATAKEYCKQNNISWHVCTIKELKSFGRDIESKNKRDLITALAKKYPQLYFKAKKELHNRNRHHTKMFEAVAAAELCASKTKS